MDSDMPGQHIKRSRARSLREHVPSVQMSGHRFDMNRATFLYAVVQHYMQQAEKDYICTASCVGCAQHIYFWYRMQCILNSVHFRQRGREEQKSEMEV